MTSAAGIDPPPDQRGEKRSFPIGLWGTFLVSLALVLLLALRQKPQPTALTPDYTVTGRIASALHARERNAFLHGTNPLSFHRVFALPNTTLAWVVGETGLILRTRDGGKSWDAQPSGTTNRLNAVWFRDQETGWAVGDTLTILHTTNGGAAWMLVPTNTIKFAPPRASSKRASLQNPSDAENFAQSNPTASALNNLNFLNINKGVFGSFAAASREAKPSNPSGVQAPNQGPTYPNVEQKAPNSDSPKTKGTESVSSLPAVQKPANLNEVAFNEQGVGLILGDGGFLLQWRPEAGEWIQSANQGLAFDPVSIDFYVSAAGGWTPSGSKPFSAPSFSTNSFFRETGTTNEQFGYHLFFLNARPGLAGTTATATATNRAINPAAQAPITRLNPEPPGDESKTTKESQTPINEVNVAGWAIGSQGLFLGTTNSGRTWETVTNLTDQIQAAGLSFAGSNAPAIFETISFASTNLGYIAGGSFLFRTADGGRSWSTPAPYKQLLAPVWWICFGVLGLCGTGLLWRSYPRAQPVPSIEGVPATDAPIEDPEKDCFDFRPMAKGIARFFLNPRTRPPLTVAISGAWGTGKSSLMNLLRKELQDNHVRPVWFNAWHHQQDEQFLASLLKAVTQQSVPPWWNPAGLMFRARLFANRFRKRFVPSLFFLLVASLVLGFLVANGPRPPATWRTWFQSEARAILYPEQPKPSPNTNSITFHLAGAGLTNNVSVENLLAAAARQTNGLTLEWDATGPPPSEKADATDTPGWVRWIQHAFPRLTFLATVLGLASAFLSRFRAFGIDPSKLLSSALVATKPAQLEAQLGFQLRFAEDFKEVTRALGSKQMVIFIDDLDRCQVPKVAESLEAINFLVSNGECFVVLGIAREQVEASLALSFAELAAETDIPDEALRDRRTGGTEEQRRRSAFARSYLRKLINLWVNVPLPSEASLLNMVAPQPRKETLIEQLKKLRSSSLKWAALVGLMVLVAIGSFDRGKWLAGFTVSLSRFLQPEPAANAVQTAAAQRDNATNNLAMAVSNSAAFKSVGGMVITNHSSQRDVWNRENTSDRWWLVLPALFGVVIIVRAFTWSRDLKFQDKPDFRQALQIWGPVVGSIASSPRERKRFVNRVRYLAMRQRGETSPLKYWKQLLLKILREPSETKHVDQNDGHEAQLVRLDVSTLVKEAKKRLSAADAKRVDSLLEKAEQQHFEAFKREPSKNEQDQYKRVVAEVEFA